MAKLRNYSNTLSELHLDLIIIAGDNYYPNKEKTGKGKTKIIKRETANLISQMGDLNTEKERLVKELENIKNELANE